MKIIIDDPVAVRTDGLGFTLNCFMNNDQIEDLIRRVLLERSIITREIKILKDKYEK